MVGNPSGIVTEIKLNDIRKPLKTPYNIDKMVLLEFEEDGEKNIILGTIIL